MNVRLAVHLTVSTVIAIALVFTGLNLWGPLGALLAMIVWYFLEQAIKALLPVSFLSSVPGTQATSAMYRDWASRLVASLGMYPSRTPAGDLARLGSGIRLGMLSHANRDGSQVLGFLVLARTGETTTSVAWRRRGKQYTEQPIDSSHGVTVHQSREQQNPVQARFGFTTSVGLGGDTYWVRPQDAELLALVLRPAEAAAAPAEPTAAAAEPAPAAAAPAAPSASA